MERSSKVMRWRQRRGATIAIVALSTAAILAMGAIAVDLSMLFKMRGDAQRTADAAALAGASAYLEFPGPLARDSAFARAWRYVDGNYIGGSPISTANKQPPVIHGTAWKVVADEAMVEFAPDIYRVRVTVRRPASPTFFGKALGVLNTPIAAYATAEATNSGGAKCVKPFALADTWNETTPGSDANGNRFWDDGESWEWDNADSYGPWDGNEVDSPGPQETGYGSSWRDQNGQGITRDRGRQLIIKPQNPQVDQVIKPGHFFAWDMPDDPNQGATPGCPASGGGNGAQDFEHNICSCNDAEVYLDTEYDLKPGNMVGPTKQGIENLVKQDAGAKWDPTADGGKGGVTGSKYASWRDSPRVIKVALYDPALEYKSGRIAVKFNNIALMFVEEYQRAQGQKEDAVIGRFITFAQGSATEGPGGPLAKVLRLVE